MRGEGRARLRGKDPLGRLVDGRLLGRVVGVVSALIVLTASAPASRPVASGLGGGSLLEASLSIPGAGLLAGGTGGAGLPGAVPGAGALAGEEPEDRGLWYSVYRVVKGDTVGDIAARAGVSVDAIVSFNDIQNTRSLRQGQLLKVPSQAGILVKAKEGESAGSLASRYDISADAVIEANGLLAEELPAGKVVFLPDARLPSFTLREINGDLFRWPVRGWITSRFGWREDPFSGARTYHNGLDIGSNRGTPILAAMEGRISATGYSATLGNYVLIAHHSGWSSFYGHMDSILVRSGQSVGLGTRIGLVGNTGYSTGPHLHFSVYKYGRPVNPSGVLR